MVKKMSEDKQIVVNYMGEPVHITLTKNAKGQYQYEISYHGSDPFQTAEVVAELTKKVEEHIQTLYEKYGRRND